jgi:hypothetical protein
MKKRQFIGYSLALMSMLLVSSQQLWAKDVTITPTIELGTVYDDNIDFDSKDEKDDFAGNVIPRLTVDYETELLQVSLIGEIDILKYFNQTNYDRTNQLYGIDGQYRMFPRWTLKGDFRFRKDESVDSQLEETGQVFEREKVKTYDAVSGLMYDLTELSDIGVEVDYRRRDFSSRDSTDFHRYTFSLPYTKRFASQRDTLSLVPAYTLFDSDDEEDATDYRLALEWEHLISETLTFGMEVGGRYTEIENQNNKNDDKFGYLGKISLNKKGETFNGLIGVSRDLRANSNGDIVEVNRFFLRADKRFLERFGFRLYGAVYRTDTESNVAVNDKTRFIEANPSIYFLITENHSINLSYYYQNQKEFDEPGNPESVRNRVWLGLELKFPKKWN